MISFEVHANPKWLDLMETEKHEMTQTRAIINFCYFTGEFFQNQSIRSQIIIFLVLYFSSISFFIEKESKSDLIDIKSQY